MHAYLIICHERFEVLGKLVEALDDARNDIYVHVDKKWRGPMPQLSTKNANVRILDQRIDGRWADFSLVEIELALLKEATSRRRYSYYHLLSGVDYPLKSQDYIHDFMNTNQGKEFIGFAKGAERELAIRARYRHLFHRQFKNRNILIRGTRKAFVFFQKLAGSRINTDIELRKGSQWWSITHDFAMHLLAREEEIRRRFRRSYCPDEMVTQTVCYNSAFYSRVYDPEDEFHGCMRYIPWENGELKALTGDDILKMRASDRLFGRKFTLKDIEDFMQRST